MSEVKSVRRILLGAVLTILLVSPGVAVLAQTAPPAPAVTVAPATLSDLSESVTFNGRAVAVQRVDLRARVSGFVEERSFAEGAPVAEGDVLFRLEDASFRASFNQVEAQIAAAQASLKLAEIERDRQAELVGRQATAQAVLDRAVAEADGAAAEVRRLQAQLEAASLNLSYTQIVAPFAGRVGLAAADVGALVGPDSGTLLTLVKTDPMTVQFPVPERDLIALQSSAQAGEAQKVGRISLILADGSDYAEPGTIDFSDVTVSTATDTVLIRAVFPNPAEVLRDGSLVRVWIEGAAAAPVLAVPQQAIQRDLLGAFVMMVDAGGVVELRRVEVSRLARGLAVVAAGLAEGDLVIIEGVNKARPGATVNAALAGEG